MRPDCLVYYDTNVWVAYMLGPSDCFFEKSKRLVDDVTLSRKTVVVSHVVILETIHTLRRKIAETYEFKGGDKGIRYAQIKKKTRDITKRFLALVDDLVKRDLALFARPNIGITDHHTSVLQKLEQYFGHIRTVSLCPYCRNSRVAKDSDSVCPNCKSSRNPVPRYDYVGLDYMDLEHAFLAKSYNVKKFYSSDRAFVYLGGDVDFKEMRFETIQ